MSRRGFELRNIDWVSFSLYSALVCIGWLMIYAVGYDENNPTSMFDLSTNAGKQGMFIGISLVLTFLIMVIDWKFWRTFAYLIYTISMVGLVGVLLFGITVKGATSWYAIAGFTVQPSEFAKFGTTLALAAYLSSYSTDLRDLKAQLTAIGLFVLPIVFIMMQPDAGSALVFTSFFLVLYREGLSPNIYIFGFTSALLLTLGLVYDPYLIFLGLSLIGTLILIFNFKKRLYLLMGFGSLVGLSIFGLKMGYWKIVVIGNFLILIGFSYYQWQQKKTELIKLISSLLIFGTCLAFVANYAFNNILESHQQDRINVWLQPSKCDPQGALYNVLQSKMTIGSGGLEGKGFLQGTLTKLNYVPEQSTDFIFCTIGEEQGFVGSFGIVVLFFLLLIRIVVIAERQRSDFSRYYAYGVAGIIFVHFFVNIGMTMGLVPIIGIPLPFISYGGSSLIGFTLLIAVLIKLDSHRFVG